MSRIVKLWDTESGALLRTFEGHSDWVRSVALSEDGKRALSGSDDRTVKLWDTQTARIVAAFSTDTSVHVSALSVANALTIAASDQSGRVHFLRLLDYCTLAAHRSIHRWPSPAPWPTSPASSTP